MQIGGGPLAILDFASPGPGPAPPKSGPGELEWGPAGPGLLGFSEAMPTEGSPAREAELEDHFGHPQGV